MSAIREYFRFLEGVGVISKSPTTGIETPKREKNGRHTTWRVIAYEGERGI
jgi:site-specific recombinase XerD